MNKVLTILRKEWAEVFKNRMIIFTVAFLPLMLTALPLGIIAGTRQIGGEASGPNLEAEMPAQINEAMCPEGLNGSACLQVFLVSQFMMMFMIIPVAIPVTIAAYSIVGEKTTRSLEPLLATPISTLELLIGKCLAAAIPAILATFAAFGLFAIGSWILIADPILLGALLDTRWLIAIFVVGPLMAIMAVTFALMVSSRVSDPRVAEQVSMVIILPVLAAFFGQIAGLFVLDAALVSWVAAVMLVLDVGLLYLAAQIFQRERILTRWK